MIPMPPPTDNFSHVQRLVPATKNGHHHSFHSTTVSEWKFNPPVFAATFISETMYKIVVMCNHVHFMTRGCGQCCWQTKFWKRAFRSIYSIQQHIFFQCYICLRSKQSSWKKKWCNVLDETLGLYEINVQVTQTFTNNFSKNNATRNNSNKNKNKNKNKKK